MTGKDIMITRLQSLKSSGTVLKTFSKIGMYNMQQWRTIEEVMAIKRCGLTKIPVLNNDCSSLIAFRAFNISITTNTVRERVEAVCFPHVK